MTSSEETELPPGVIDELSRRVGSCLEGDHDGQGRRIALICSRFNGGITWRLLQGALEALESCGVDPADCTVAWVPGAFELPLAARRFAESGDVDAVVCMGAVIRGETAHYDLVAGECAAGIQRVQLDTGVPVSFGVLTTETALQARQRSEPGGDNKGWAAVETAVEMVRLFDRAPMRGGLDPAGDPGRPTGRPLR